MLDRLKEKFNRHKEVTATNIMATVGRTRAPLSVNNLSRLSDKLTTMGRGENIKRASFWICFVFSAWFLADLFSLLVEKYLPTPPVSMLSTRQRGGVQSANVLDYEVIITRNLFSSKAPKKTGGEIDLEAEPVPTTLPLQLVGTVIFMNPARSMAAIQDKNESKVYPVRMGDEIEDKCQILSVEPRKVIFINLASRRKEYIDIPEDPSIKISTNAGPSRPAATGNIAEVEENKFVVKRQEIDQQLGNFNSLLTQALAKPEMRGGQMVGFRITQIQPGSFFSKILKENDVLTAVNGEKITDAAKALSLMQELKNNHLNSVEIGIERGGKAITQSYDIR
jgi:general secretion pathway protein C